MAGHDPADEVHPDDLVDVGDTVVVDHLQVICTDFGEASLAALEGGPSVVIAFHGKTLVDEEERTVRVLIPSWCWPTVDRLATDAIAAELARAAEEEPSDTCPADLVEVWDLDVDEYDADGDWEVLSCDLIEVIEVLDPGQFLILSGPDNRFVQLFVDEHDAQLETVSNQFLAPEHRMGFEVLDLLEEQGWTRPTHFPSSGPLPEGASPNHFMELGEHWQAEEVAALMISTLRHIHRVPSPVEVAYTAGSINGDKILLPSLGLPRAGD